MIRHEGPVSLVLRGVRVLDEAGGFTDPVDLMTTGGRVKALAPRLPAARGHRDIDADGLWLLPGVVDCHVHIGLPSFDALELLRTPLSLRTLETAQALRRTLLAGVTCLRDAGGTDGGVREAVTRGYVPGPRLQVSVLAIGPTGGHGDGFLAGPGMECAHGLLGARLSGTSAPLHRRTRGDAQDGPPPPAFGGGLDQADGHGRRPRRWRRPLRAGAHGR